MRATSPGAEIREAQRVAAAQKEAEEKRKRALYQSSVSQPVSRAGSSLGASPAAGLGPASVPPSPGRAHSLRRFQISRSSSPSLGSLRGSAGIQKRRMEGATPVLVEQLRRTPHSRQASLVADLVGQAQADGSGAVQTSDMANVAPAKPRKRPVVNQAERRWRQERQGAISAAKQHLSETLERSAQANQSTWDDESERLAREFEQVALEIERDVHVDHDDGHVQTSQSARFQPVPPPKPLKVQPRLPKGPRAVPPSSAEMGVDVPSSGQPMDESDDDFVYDVYIRRPIAERDMLTNPLAELESEQQLKQLEASNQGIGVIVITAEDEEYWEHFVEDDEEEWDSEDADSNGEFSSCLSFLSLFAGSAEMQDSERRNGMILANHVSSDTPQPRTIQPTTTQTKNSRQQTRMTIRRPYMANIDTMPRLTTRSTILIIPTATTAPGSGRDLDIRGALTDTWTRMRIVIDFACGGLLDGVKMRPSVHGRASALGYAPKL